MIVIVFWKFADTVTGKFVFLGELVKSLIEIVRFGEENGFDD